jgi:hypothetical protein
VIHNLLFRKGVTNHLKHPKELITILTIKDLGVTLVTEQSEAAGSDVNGAAGDSCFGHGGCLLIT